MNYDHNNLRLKKIQGRIVKAISIIQAFNSHVKPSKEEVRLEVKSE